eukprot:1964169-Amphidinium_carterae.1
MTVLVVQNTADDVKRLQKHTRTHRQSQKEGFEFNQEFNAITLHPLLQLPLTSLKLLIKFLAGSPHARWMSGHPYSASEAAHTDAQLPCFAPPTSTSTHIQAPMLIWIKQPSTHYTKVQQKPRGRSSQMPLHKIDF